RYANEVVDAFGLRPHLRLSTAVTEVVWDEADQHWVLSTDTGDTHVFDVVISALGLLNVPNQPDWPGLEDFRGVAVHTARWRHDVDLTGKHVAVVGTGSTAAQVEPGIADKVASLRVFQREPGWVEPKRERPFTPRERWIYRHVPGAQRAHRAWLFAQSIARFTAYDATSRAQHRKRRACL